MFPRKYFCALPVRLRMLSKRGAMNRLCWGASRAVKLRKLISGMLTPQMRARAIHVEHIGRDKIAPAIRLLGFNRKP